MASKAIIAYLLELPFGTIQPAPVASSLLGHEIKPRLMQMKAHPVGIDNLHLPDFFVQGLICNLGR